MAVALRRPMLLLVPLVLAAGLALAPGAHAGVSHSLTRTSGPATATLTWTQQDFESSDVRLTIVREDVTLLDAGILDENGTPTADRPQALRVRDLDGDGEPEVVVDLFTGGAHCCLHSLIYRYDAAAGGSYIVLRHFWGNAGYRVRELDGDDVPELRSADDRFAYEFTAYAFSGLPLQIWRLVDGALVDVTASFPALLRTDAARWWRLYVRERRHEDSDVRGVFAAWLAEKYLLEERADGLARLASGRRAGYFSGPVQGAPPWPAGRRYSAELRRFLLRLGYGG
jgi:hypothetical protein